MVRAATQTAAVEMTTSASLRFNRGTSTFERSKRTVEPDARKNWNECPEALSALCLAAMIKLPRSGRPTRLGPLDPEQPSGVTDPDESVLKETSS
jgi:hypothetical protein